jgi:hypothetical protein
MAVPSTPGQRRHRLGDQVVFNEAQEAGGRRGRVQHMMLPACAGVRARARGQAPGVMRVMGLAAHNRPSPTRRACHSTPSASRAESPPPPALTYTSCVSCGLMSQGLKGKCSNWA